MIPFTWHSRKDWTCGKGWTTKGQFTREFCRWWKYLDCLGSYMTMYLCQIHRIIHQKKENFAVCIFLSEQKFLKAMVGSDSSKEPQSWKPNALYWDWKFHLLVLQPLAAASWALSNWDGPWLKQKHVQTNRFFEAPWDYTSNFMTQPNHVDWLQSSTTKMTIIQWDK